MKLWVIILSLSASLGSACLEDLEWAGVPVDVNLQRRILQELESLARHLRPWDLCLNGKMEMVAEENFLEAMGVGRPPDFKAAHREILMSEEGDIVPSSLFQDREQRFTRWILGIHQRFPDIQGFISYHGPTRVFDPQVRARLLPALDRLVDLQRTVVAWELALFHILGDTLYREIKQSEWNRIYGRAQALMRDFDQRFDERSRILLPVFRGYESVWPAGFAGVVRRYRWQRAITHFADRSGVDRALADIEQVMNPKGGLD